jgi:hypothetical protein
MSATSMTIKTFKKVAVKLPPGRAILLRANHGVGKSKVIRQVSAVIRKELLKLANPAYPILDERLGQKTEGDMVGLPSTDGEVTRFNPPDRYKRACTEPCVLFFDELNRGTPEVMQAVFQIVLDRELNNGMRLHPQTRVYAAINASAAYTVNEIDPALLDRFYCIDLEPDAKEFCAWARDADPEQGGNLHYLIPDFIDSNEKWLYPAKNADIGSVQPSPRSWEMINESLVFAGIIEQPDDDLFYQICRGFVGNEASIAFRDYCMTADSRITGEEIVNKLQLPLMQSKVARQGQERQNGLIEKVADYVIKNCDKLNDQQGQNVSTFMKMLPDELRISLWSKLTSHGIDKIELAKSIHKWCAETVLSVFGVPIGEAGIGIVPNVPGIFRAPVKTGKK